jgi:CDP-diacylglycerol--glycerol-3-phosphate 3-phosphatidyltransferase
MIDLAAGGLVGVITAAGAVAWSSVGRGRAPRFERIDRAGASVFLGADVQRGAYWAAQPLGRALMRLGVSANAITLCSIPISALGAWAFAGAHYGVGALLAGLAFACDALDGLVARAAGTASEAGEILDVVCDRIGETLLLGGVAVAWRASVPLLTLVLVAGLGAQQVTFASTTAQVYTRVTRAVPRGLMRRAERAVYFVGGAAMTGMLSDALPASSRAWAVAPLAAALALVAVVANGSAVHRFIALARALRSSPREHRHAAE